MFLEFFGGKTLPAGMKSDEEARMIWQKNTTVEFCHIF